MIKLIAVAAIPKCDLLSVFPKIIQKINEKNDSANQSKNK